MGCELFAGRPQGGRQGRGCLWVRSWPRGCGVGAINGAAGVGLPVGLQCGSWCARRDGQVLGEQEGTCEVTMPDDDQHCLRLLCVGRGAAGPLACEVSNRHGTARCTLHLRLAGRCPRARGLCPSAGGWHRPTVLQACVPSGGGVSPWGGTAPQCPMPMCHGGTAP